MASTRLLAVSGWFTDVYAWQVNRTHITLQNTLAIALVKERTISRRDLKVVWKCIYPRHYVSNARVASDTLW